MSSSQALREIELRLPHLGREERRQLALRLKDELRQAGAVSADRSKALAEMAADPEIQRELAEIDAEFAQAHSDGLEPQP